MLLSFNLSDKDDKNKEDIKKFVNKRVSNDSESKKFQEKWLICHKIKITFNQKKISQNFSFNINSFNFLVFLLFLLKFYN